MKNKHDVHTSVWLADAPQTDYPPLHDQITANVAVIGGGITGLTSALLLQRAGLDVVLLEANHIGCGVTGKSTAKLTSLHRLTYAQIEHSFGEEAAHTYAEANEVGLARIKDFVMEAGEMGIDCSLEQQAAYTYTTDENQVDTIREEAEAAARAGLLASFITECDLPFPIAGAVRVDNQAQFHAYRYCVYLAKAFTDAGGAIYENTRAQDVTVQDPTCRVTAGAGGVVAEQVVVATLLPFLDRGAFFAKAFPSRSYGIAAILESSPPQGMYINIETPTRSLRPLPKGAGIIIVGEQHKVGQDKDTRDRYAALEAWARENFDIRSIDYRWSAQDYFAADNIPYIGKLSEDRLWTATGFNKWGLTTGTAAAIILSDLIQGTPNPWADLFDATRKDLVPSAKKLIVENADVAKHFVGDRLKSMSAPKADELIKGEGAIIDHDGEKIAAYRDDSGVIHACSPICTHMGCHVQWNTAEKSWDCPCHGSRFDYEGRILQGPAVNPLEKKDLQPARE